MGLLRCHHTKSIAKNRLVIREKKCSRRKRHLLSLRPVNEALPLLMTLVCKAELAPNVCFRLVKGIVVPPSEALKDGMIDASYSSAGN